MQSKLFKTVFQIVQWATIGVFLGRAWQHFFFDMPLRALLWDQSLMEGFIQVVFGMDWTNYATNPAIQDGILLFQRIIAGLYVACALSAILINRFPRIARILLSIGTISLLFLAVLYYKEKFYAIGQFWEYSLQWGAPLLLLFLHRRQELTSGMLLLMKLGIALTFTCHGLYAIGYYPRPAYFMEMVMLILKVDETIAIYFLNTAGVLDFLISILIFLPHRIAFLGLLYACTWGFFTTIARIWAYFHLEFWQESLYQWTHESVMRLPHFLIPLAALLITWQLLRSKNA